VLIDTHCHLADDQFNADVELVVERARAAGVQRFVVPAVDVATAERTLRLAERFEEVYAAVGIHPESLHDLPEQAFDEIRAMAAHPKVVAIGEIGLDYYWDVAPRPIQQEVFARQMQLAAELSLPILVHNRDATEDTVRMVQTAPTGLVGSMHCFTGSIDIARQCINKGFFISFGGPVTFKNARDVQDTASQVPDDWLIVETDSPYLSPQPLRGQRNEPARVRLVAEKLALLRGRNVEEIETLTTENALRLFPKLRMEK